MVSSSRRPVPGRQSGATTKAPTHQPPHMQKSRNGHSPGGVTSLATQTERDRRSGRSPLLELDAILQTERPRYHQPQRESPSSPAHASVPTAGTGIVLCPQGTVQALAPSRCPGRFVDNSVSGRRPESAFHVPGYAKAHRTDGQASTSLVSGPLCTLKTWGSKGFLLVRVIHISHHRNQSCVDSPLPGIESKRLTANPSFPKSDDHQVVGERHFAGTRGAGRRLE